ncbi:MAG TPA: alanine--glyoxylate aminotransferase family protein, partial [Armatimonadota bacterium]|nr:alanine--glyoxylate aminotransferase family protein [Armatimonadota bacterium]
LEPKPILMIPGPTPCPDRVLRALSQPMINHRGPEYMALQRELVSGLKTLFQTANDVQIFPASGTGGLEAAIVNVLSPGDRVLAVPTGSFGARFAEIAQVYGADVRRLEVEWGQAADPQAIAQALSEEPDVKALLLTHNETSTGVLHDIQATARAARQVKPDVLILVDSISGMLAADIRPDEWDLDVVVAGSQKAWMIPPGLTFLSISPRAWAANKTAKMPRFYFDFGRMKKSMETDQTPYTPALPQLFGLQVALRHILEEGLEHSFRRHARMAAATRAAVQALGLELFAAEGHYSNSLTAVRVPQGATAKELRGRMREKHGVVIAGGQGPIKDQIFRLGHLGYVDDNDVIAMIGALELTLRELGFHVQPGQGVAAAQTVFAG